MKNKYHKNGDVSFWNVYRQEWMRINANCITDNLLATMNDVQREQIARHAKRYPETLEIECPTCHSEIILTAFDNDSCPKCMTEFLGLYEDYFGPPHWD